MKVSIGSKIIDGPYGGGNTFVLNLKKYLEDNDHSVIDNLEEDDIDIILLINPLRFSEISTFDHFDIYKYLNEVNNKAIVVQRINECDERKNTRNVNKQIMLANKISDFTIYVSSWLDELYRSHGLNSNERLVVKSGSDSKIFNQQDKNKWDGKSKFSLVTHHWSSNWMKGFDTYSFIDKMLNEKRFSDLFSFTYIGNIPKNFIFNNTKVISPLSGENLATELKKYDGYITGSINEPSGNHHIEAGLCGLPILYFESGGIPEYANEYGLSFSDPESLEEKIYEFISNYDQHYKNLKYFPYVSTKMCEDYLNSFNEILENKETYFKQRKKPSFFIFKLELLKYNLIKFIFKTKMFILKIIRGNFEK
tara:strand:+ start:365 stop:1459 length:1095 start_codon:yes stop_codon:yes gene_type:complete